MKKDVFARLTVFLNNLERGKISYTLQSNREQAIMVIIAIPGERWEVEFLADGSVEVERFISEGEIYGEEVLRELLTQYSDQDHQDSEAVQGATLPRVTEPAFRGKSYRKTRRSYHKSRAGEAVASQAQAGFHRSGPRNKVLQRTRKPRD